MSSARELARFLRFLPLLRRHRGDPAAAYDSVAAVYDQFAAVWDGRIARRALRRVDEIVAERAWRGSIVLDAAAGTGERTRAILSYGHPGQVVALDASAEMLRLARSKVADPRVVFVRGDLCALPFPDDTFDLVCCTWAVEILADPRVALREFVRVMKPDGLVVYAFCSLPYGPTGAVLDYVRRHMSAADEPLTHLLAASDQPVHRCRRSSIQRFSGGLTTVATVAKCCPIEAQALPCAGTDAS